MNKTSALKKISKALAVLTLAFGIVLLSACSTGGGSTETTYTRADCKARLTKDMIYAQDHPEWDGNKVKPKECKDISDAEAAAVVDEIVDKALEDAIDEAFEEAFSSPTP